MENKYFLKLLALKELINRNGFFCSKEKDLQDDLGNIFNKSGLPFSREHLLSKRDRVDFYLPRSKIAVEVKLHLGWSKVEVLRQLERYSEHKEVEALALVTNIPMGLPKEINGKPAIIIKINNGAI